MTSKSLSLSLLFSSVLCLTLSLVFSSVFSLMARRFAAIFSACCCLMVFTGCSTGSCLREQKPKETSAAEIKTDSVSLAGLQIEKVKVFKFDGSKQCGSAKSISAAEMQSELKDIKVFSSSSKNDGQMRIQLCGSPTGNANIYEIDKADLNKAIKYGFKEWIFE